ncbi:DedA family protein [Cohnella nanjingensis]|uniref:DedA family protein n=1 Tax=Cohnella nanjingensis TaxID=1387779 RepID=A0A7X0RPC0_9BACL|nr:DedA family protein [Cohnella nanjingensis]MBB6671135.1 DedA family protein [Cohnella nanjingensis]
MTDSMLALVFHYGYWGLFAAIALGIVGLPMPDEVLLTAAGFLLSRGHLNLGLTMLAAVSGSLVGMSVSYAIGRTVGRPLLARFGSRVRLSPDKLAKHEERFAKWGHMLVLLGYFVPGLRHATALLIGMGKHPYRTFLVYASVGALAWTSCFLLLGQTLGDHWREVTAFVQPGRGFMTAALIAMLAMLVWLWRRYAWKRRASE